MEETLQYQIKVLAALHQVMLDLITRHDFDDILRTLLQKIGEMLDAPHVSIDLIENDDTLVTYAATPGQPLEKGGAILVLPLRLGEQVIGAINIQRDEIGKPFNETDLYAGEQLAQMVGPVLDSAQAYQRLQAELAEHRHSEEELRLIQAQVIEQQRQVAAFEERQHLARNLHDSVNQSIHSLVLFAETLTSTLDKEHYDRARYIATRLEESARQALKETRLMLYELQPSPVGEILDLIALLENRLSTVERRAGVQAQILLEGDIADCPCEWYENLFWIAIEALNNALKHAQARKVEIALRCNPHNLEMVVTDNGIGFEVDKPRAGGIGLRNLRERANLLGGELNIDSAPGAGARVRFKATI